MLFPEEQKLDNHQQRKCSIRAAKPSLQKMPKDGCDDRDARVLRAGKINQRQELRKGGLRC